MKKVAFILCLLTMCLTRATARYVNHVVDLYIDPAMALPLGSMSTYYSMGGGGGMHLVASLSKRRSILRISAVANMGYYHFGGKDWMDAYFNEHTADPINVIPVHAGLRADLGNTKDEPYGIYLAQDLGTTFIPGKGGGSRFGHMFYGGFTIGAFDTFMGYEKWKRSTGSNFGFFVLGMGIRLF